MGPIGSEALPPAALRHLLRAPNPDWFQQLAELAGTNNPARLEGFSQLQLFASALLLLKGHMATNLAEATAAASCSDGAGLHTARSPEGGSMAWQELLSVLPRLRRVMQRDFQALCKICAEHLLPRARLDAVRRLGQALARLGSEPVQEPRSPRSPSHQGEVMAAKSEGMARLQMTESSGPSAFRKPAVHRGKTLPNLTSMIRRDPAFAAAENAKAAESEDEIAEVEDL
ncbi:unnamed protein product [Effrenium voratum]|uniref:Uncharacterized protein n=1 Tax=Effrenium voratum TaxID=2562239 RepID=A0AA36IKT4_9DINO|nr:unnamed protein product [Effrenium voratum]